MNQQRPSEKVEHYTPHWIVQLAKDLMGHIDLDPASSEKANTIIGATHFYTKETNGLIVPWAGNVFCNPPGQPSKWFKKATHDYVEGSINKLFFVCYSIDRLPTLLRICNNETMYHRPLIMIPHRRVQYLHCETLEPQKQPLHGSAFIYLQNVALIYTLPSLQEKYSDVSFL